MPRLTVISPVEMVRLLERMGFRQVRQRGSHVRMAHADGRKTTVPLHSSDLPRGTIRAILSDVGIPRGEYECRVQNR